MIRLLQSIRFSGRLFIDVQDQGERQDFGTSRNRVIVGLVGMTAWTAFAARHADLAATPDGRVLLALPILFMLLRILPH